MQHKLGMLHWLTKPFKVETKALPDLDADLLTMLSVGMPSASGATVSPVTAMRATPVRAAVQAIAEPVGQLPLHVFRRNGDDRQRDDEHPVARVLADPNEWTSSQDFREQLQRDCLLHGNAYAFINRVDGRPAELLRLEPGRVSVKADEATGAPRYSISANNNYREIARRDIFHIKAPSLDGLKGESPVTQCREAIGIILTIEKHVARLFGSGARPGGVITIPGNIGDEGLKKMRNAWRAAHEGAENAGRTAILWGGSKFDAHTFNSVDSQTLQLWQHAINEVARIYRVPPTLMFEYGRATWANSAEMRQEFLTFSLLKWLEAWQSEIRLKLFSEEERGTFYAEFLVDDMLRADIQTRATAYSTLVSSRILNPNEIRAMENKPPYEGGSAFLNPNTTTNTPPEGTTE